MTHSCRLPRPPARRALSALRLSGSCLAVALTVQAAAVRAESAPDGAALFVEHCAACHGAGGEGAEGVAPSLIDTVWIWGGTRDAVLGTIAHGVRNENPRSRRSVMPSFGADGLLLADEIDDLAQTLLRASGAAADPAASDRGAALYPDYCASCHGENFGGDVSLGAPRLSSGVWLFGGTAEQIAAQIAEPQHGEMPGWLEPLGEAAVRALADHVMALPTGG